MAAETIKSAGKMKPGKALTDLWDAAADTAEMRQVYNQLPDNARAYVNLWAQLEPEQREAVLHRIEAERQG